MAIKKRGFLWFSTFGLLALLTGLVGAVIALALHFQASPAPFWITLWLATLGLALLVAFRKGLLASIALILVAVAVFSLWWTSIRPTNEAVWQPDVARLLTGEIDPARPSQVTLSNVRNFDWRTPDEFTERWETRSYDLDQIRSIDLILTTWGSPAIAHTMVSFGFEDGEHIVFSIGIRPTTDQSFSSIAGFFKTYGLILTAADERDVVRLRTNVQEGNIVGLYRIAMPRHIMRGLFVEYVDLANDLARQPRFYRTILANCTTMIWRLVDQIDPGLKMDYRLLLTGYLPEYLYEQQALDMRYSLETLKAMGLLPTDLPDMENGAAYSRAMRTEIPPL